jgi:hypothetical protein
MKALLKTYLRALYTENWDEVLDMLHQGDMQRSYEITLVMAEVMEPFGETAGFLQHSGISSLKELKEMGARHFFRHLIQGSMPPLEEISLDEFLEGLETSDLQIEGERARMQYRLPNPFWEGDYLESEIHFARVGEEWKILFKPGIVDVWLSFQQEVDLYHERKARDQVEEGEDVEKKREGEMLTPFLLWGYKDAEGKVVIEPRFKQAEAFRKAWPWCRFSKNLATSTPRENWPSNQPLIRRRVFRKAWPGSACIPLILKGNGALSIKRATSHCPFSTKMPWTSAKAGPQCAKTEAGDLWMLRENG